MNNRWVQLWLGIIAMVMIANLQYAWTLFVDPMHVSRGWTKTEIQVAFSLFVLFEVWLVPVNGWLVDSFGPRPFMLLAGLLVGASWFIFSVAEQLPMLYFGAIVGGIGAGIVYGTTIGAAVKNFPDRRGLAAGLTAAGFGGGAALTVLPISHIIKTGGYQSAFFTFGLIQGIVIVVCALFFRRPQVDSGAAPAALTPRTVAQTQRTYTPPQMLSTPQFYLLYVMFVMVATGLLFMTAQLAPLAKDYGLDKVPVSVFGVTILTLQLALLVDNILNGGSRILFGYLSDFIGRERAMALAFTIEAVGLFGLLIAHTPGTFILFAGLTFVASGEIYSLFPASCTDLFGARFATTNVGLLYTAKGTASFVVPIASLIRESSGGWSGVIVTLGALNVLVALLAFFVLKPMRERMLAAEAAATPSTPSVKPLRA